VRLLIQFAAAGWALWQLNGIGPLHLGWIIWDWGWVGQAVALVGLVWMINLYNFMDGIDGLAGVEAVCASGLGGLLLARSGLGEAVLALGGASAGFLVWNWPPAKVFMGDVGSGFLGVVFGVLAIASAKERPWLVWVWLILLAVFVVDSTLTLIRRLIAGARWYEAHCCHAYQHAARRWGSHSKVTLAMMAVNLGWLFPLAWGAFVWPAFGPLFAGVALAPLVYVAFRYDAGQDTPSPKVEYPKAEARAAAGSQD
jgi:Fuc2NAc and GlcNAc transferase